MSDDRDDIKEEIERRTGMIMMTRALEENTETIKLLASAQTENHSKTMRLLNGDPDDIKDLGLAGQVEKNKSELCIVCENIKKLQKTDLIILGSVVAFVGKVIYSYVTV